MSSIGVEWATETGEQVNVPCTTSTIDAQQITRPPSRLKTAETRVEKLIPTDLVRYTGEEEEDRFRTMAREIQQIVTHCDGNL